MIALAVLLPLARRAERRGAAARGSGLPPAG